MELKFEVSETVYYRRLEGSVVKSEHWLLLRRPLFNSQYASGSPLSVTLVSGTPMPSSGLGGHQTHGPETYTGKTSMYLKYI